MRWFPFLAVLAMAGCSTMQSRPEQPTQQAIIAAAQATALAGCDQLAQRALSDGTLDKLTASLAALGTVLEHGDMATLSQQIGAIDPTVAPYAGAIAGLAWLAVSQIPEDEAQATYFHVIRGVVDGCAIGLGARIASQ